MTNCNIDDVLDRVFANSGLGADQRQVLVDHAKKKMPVENIDGTISAPDGASIAKETVISNIDKQGLWITKSGTYILEKDLIWTPDINGPAPFFDIHAGIIIAADDVVLDLNGHSIKTAIGSDAKVDNDGAEATSMSAIFVGITKNVTIKNGAIIDAQFRGISAYNSENLSLIDILVSGITYNNVNLRNAFPAGIYLHACDTANVINCTVQYGYVTADLAGGLVVFSCENVTISGCSVNNFTNFDGSMQGFPSYTSVGVSWSDCTVTNLQSFFNGNIRTGGHTVIGYMPTLSADITVTNCTARNIIGSRDDCHGMSFFICADGTASNFVADTVIDGPAPYNIGAKATGFEIYGWDITAENCDVSHIYATCPQDLQSTGISVWGKNIKVTGCVAKDVMVFDRHGKASTENGYGTGFGWAPDPRHILCYGTAEMVSYTNCVAEDCQLGFDSWYHISSTWTDIAAPGCDTKMLVQSDPPAERTVFADPISECNPPQTTVLVNLAKDNIIRDMLI